MNRKILIGASLAVIVIVAVAVFLSSGMGRPRRGLWNSTEMSLNESRIAEVTEVFESAGSPDDISGYCSSNRIDCGYYCANVNPEHEFCSELRRISFRR